MRFSTPPNDVPIEPFFSKSLKQLATKFNGRLGSLRTCVEQLQGSVADAQKADASQVDFETVIYGNTFRSQRTALLQEELRLRDELAELLDAVAVELNQAANAGEVEYQKKQAEIREKLIAIGYQDSPDPAQAIGRIKPDFIFTHPAVAGARNAFAELRGRAAGRDAHRANEAAIELISNELNRLRDAAIGAAPVVRIQEEPSWRKPLVMTDGTQLR